MVECSRDMRINEPLGVQDKNTMQVYIGDLDILSSDSYQGKWVQKYANLKA